MALARAVVVRPQMLLLDEPLSNLDAKIRHRVRVEIRALQCRTGITAIYVTHDQEEAMCIADMVVVMEGGRVAQAGRPEEVYAHPKSPFVAEFLGSTNVLAAVMDPDGRILPSATGSLIFRAEDIQLASPQEPTPAGSAWVDGEVVDVLFIGAGYRAYIRVGEEVVMADHRTPMPRGAVRAVIPFEKVFAFGRD